MGKKIRFPLELADGAQVRNIEELREHFDLESVLGHYKNGTLLTWLRDRYMEAEADAVEALEEDKPNFQGQLCSILGVEYGGEDADLEAIERRQQRLEKLRALTGEKECWAHVDQVAFDQEELADLLDDNVEKIYLCGEQLFTVPASRKNVEYVGINQPRVHISGHIEGTTAPHFIGCNVENAASGETSTDTLDDLKCDELIEYSATAIVTHVQLDTGERGFRTVQVYFEESVCLDGVEYEHVPVLNYDLFQEMDLRKGSEVRVHRVGDVTPSITVIKQGKGDPIKVNTTCTCGDQLIIKHKKLCCKNPACQSNVIGRLTGFIEALGIEEYNEAFIKHMVETSQRAFCDRIYDIRSLITNTTPAQLKKQEKEIRDNYKEYHNQYPDKYPHGYVPGNLLTKKTLAFHDVLVDAIAKAPDYIILSAMGIPRVSPALALLIIKDAGGFKNLCNWEMNSPHLGTGLFAGLISNPFTRNIPCTLFSAVGRFLDDKIFIRDLIEVYRHMQTFTAPTTEAIRVGYTGGNLSIELEAACDEKGFQIVDGNDFDILLVPTHDHSSPKVDKAKKDEILMYTEHEFRTCYDPCYEWYDEVDEDDDADCL